MSNAKTPVKAEHGTFYKVTETSLGVISAASLVLNLIPGLNLIGAAVQGGVTLVETGMNLATGQTKKAAISFATGTIFTALSIIPELGAAAKGTEIVAKVIGGSAKTAEAVGAAGKTAEAASVGADAVKTGFFGKAWDVAARPFKATWNGVKHVGGKAAELPGIRNVVGATKTHVITPLNKAEAYLSTGAADGLGKAGFEGLKKNNRVLRGASKLYGDHKIGRKVVQTGMFLGATGASILGDVPPGNIVNKVHDFSQGAPNEETMQWREHVNTQRQQKLQQLSKDASDQAMLASTAATVPTR